MGKNKFITEPDVLELLRAIRDGKVTVQPLIRPQGAESLVTYETSNKWTIKLFLDWNEWDYIDSISHGAKTIRYNEIVLFMRKVIQFFPTEEEAWRIWGIPGYLKHRCEECGRILTGMQPEMPNFTCSVKGRTCLPADQRVPMPKVKSRGA